MDKTYVNIVGAGLSGLSAAIALAEKGIGTNLISAMPSERAQSVLAEGGINAALDLMGEGDSPAQHFEDTMRGGAFLADPNAVAGLAEHAPEVVRWLLRLGVPFQREGERMIQRSFGGQKKRRTAYARSSTGKVLMTALIDEARRYEAAGLIRRFSNHELYDLNRAGDRCTGVTVRDTRTGALLSCAGTVILTCGGMNGLFPGNTTGTTLNTGHAAARVFASGVAFGNLEMIQYHPTTVAITGKRMLVSEAARGEGGRLFVERSGAPWYFMEELYPELGNLMPRDVISREMVRVTARPDCGEQVYLDLRGLSDAVWEKRLPDLREEIGHYLALDPARDPVPVSPGIHFFMGGVLVDEGHRTSLSGLYAAGECACQYHGANRLGGNSLLAAVYGGRVAAGTVAAEMSVGGGEPADAGTAPERLVSPARTAALRDALLSGLGILRDGESLGRALDRTEALLGEPDLTELERDRILLGTAMLRSALLRRESRGAHTRTDFPDRDDENFHRTTVARRAGDRVEITLCDIPERRDAT